MKFLAFNAGGRSHRVIAYDVDAAAAAKLEPAASFWDAEDESATTHFRDLIGDAPQPDVAVHRVVHGGLHGDLDDDAPVDAAVIGAIEDAIEFAPGHNRLALDGIAAVTERFGDAVRQVVVLDHALRADAPRVATMLSGPSSWASDHAMRRIGFHGISHHDVIERVSALLERDDARVVTVHVGSGCSLAAFRGHRMLDTTMGMTPMAGVMMTERAGDVDPGALLFLLRHGLEDLASLEQQLNHASGLLGLSGVSADTRDCYAAIDAGNERAAQAMELFAYRMRQAVGAFAATLGGIDAIAFSGPAGEHQPRLRAAICENLAHLGIAADARRNDDAVADAEIGVAGAGARAFAIRTLEEWAMVRRAARVVSPGA